MKIFKLKGSILNPFLHFINIKKYFNYMRIFKFIFTLMSCIIIFSCNSYTYTMFSTPVSYLNKHELDSICNVNNIPVISNDNWIYSMFKDDISETYIHQYVFISKNDTTEKTYICTDLDSMYRFNIRTLKKIKK